MIGIETSVVMFEVKLVEQRRTQQLNRMRRGHRKLIREKRGREVNNGAEEGEKVGVLREEELVRSKGGGPQ